MAEAPKSTKTDAPGSPTADKVSDASATASKGPKTEIEDAVVIGETAPEKPKGAAPAKSPQAKSAPAAADTGKARKPTARPVTEPPAQPRGTAGSDDPFKSGTEDTTKPKSDAVRADTGDRARRRGGVGSFVGLLLGGIAAAVVGFVAARTVVPEGWPFPGVPPKEDPLAGAVEAQGAQIATLDDQLATLGADLDALKSDTSALDALRDGVTGRLDALQGRLDGIASEMTALETRLAAVEKLAPEGSAAAEAAAAAYARELAELRTMFEGELAEIDAAQAQAAALEEQVAEAARAAAGRAALAQVLSALDTGEPFADALAELTETTGVSAPEALASVSAAGAPALSDLQSAFPPAARAALDAATRAAVEDGSMGRMEAFLRTQLGTRSLEPRDGDDADAVLSRAEAALRTGDLAAVLAELDRLPEAAGSALADWRGQVETRADALAAAEALADELNTQ